jgi:hypothetical protein
MVCSITEARNLKKNPLFTNDKMLYSNLIMATNSALLEDSESLFRENKDYIIETIFWLISFNLAIQQPHNLKK